MAMGRIVQMGREGREGKEGLGDRDGYRKWRGYGWVRKDGRQIGLMFLLAAFFVAAWVGIDGSYIIYYIVQMVERVGKGRYASQTTRLQDYEFCRPTFCVAERVFAFFAIYELFSRYNEL